MRGLFEKDFRLLSQNRQTLVLFLMMAGFLGLTQNGTFVLGYLSFMFSILLTSTISYDEMDQGFELDVYKRQPWITQYDFWRELFYFHKYVGVSNTFALYTATKRSAELSGTGNGERKVFGASKSQEKEKGREGTG